MQGMSERRHKGGIMDEEILKKLCKLQKKYTDGLLEANLEGNMATAGYYVEFINDLQEIINE